MGKVYFVGTPIGNLEDITLRALKVLKSVDIIACEDTRRAKILLSAHDIHPPRLFMHHLFNEASSTTGLIELVEKGSNVALISDAGMPGISDPGYNLMRVVIERGIDYEVIPGPSALTTTVLLANMAGTFTFHGFLKPKSGQRQNFLKALPSGMHVAFLSPHKVAATMADFLAVYGPDLNVFIGRELTKLHETHYRGKLSEVMQKEAELLRGELTIAWLVTTHV